MFSCHVLVVQTVLVGVDVCPTLNTVASPAELVLYYHCINTSSAGLHKDIGVGGAIFPSDTKNLSEATLVEFLHGIHMTSVCNPRLAHVEW